jgi:hypothetical protein
MTVPATASAWDHNIRIDDRDKILVSASHPCLRRARIARKTGALIMVLSIMDERSFPGPWYFEEISEGYRVLDANDRVLAYVVASDQSAGEQSKALTRDEAWQIARVISSLPDVIKNTPAGHTKWSWLKWPKLGSN